MVKAFPYNDRLGFPCRIINRTELRNGLVLATVEYPDGSTKNIKESRLTYTGI